MFKKPPKPTEIKNTPVIDTEEQDQQPKPTGYNVQQFSGHAVTITEICNLLLGINQRLDVLISKVDNEEQ